MKTAIAELERQVAEIDEARARLDQRRDRIAAVLADLRELEGGAPAPVRPLTVVRGGKRGAAKATKPHTGGRGRAVSEHVLVNARTIAERDGLRAAADRTGVAYGTLWSYAKKQGWTIPDQRGQPRKAPVPSRGRRKVVGTECPNCHVVSPENPCSCGTAKKVSA